MGTSDVLGAAYPPPARAVVVASTAGRVGNGESYSIVVKEIRAGQEVEIAEKRNEWVQVSLPSGTECWVPAASIEKV